MEATPQSIHVLHVDDEPDLPEMAAEHLTRFDERFAIDVASRADEALDRIEENGYDCIVSDYDMPGLDGIEFLKAVREDHPDLPFILHTGKGSEEVAAEAISAGVSDYLQKEEGADQYALLANRITNLVTQRRAERKLERESHRFRKLFENTNDAVAWIGYDEDPPITEDSTPIIREANPAFRAMFEPADGEVVGQPLDDVVAAEDRREEAESVSQQVIAGTQRSAELTRDTVDGPRTFLWRAVLVDDPDGGEVRNSFAVYTDISERKERERQLEAERERFRTLFDQLTQPTVEVEYEGSEPIIQQVNPAFEAAFGYDENTLVGESLDDYIVPEDRTDEAKDINRRVREGGRLVSEEVTRMTADGPREFLLQNAVYEDGSGGFAVYMDVTDRKRREQELREKTRRNDRFRTLIDQTSDIIFVVDEKGEISYINEAVEETLGYDPEELVGQVGFDIIHPEDVESAREELRRTIDDSTYIGNVEFRALHANGSTVDIEVRASNQLHNPNVDGVVVVARDITERKAREAALEQYERLVEVAGDPMYMLDATGHIEYVNEKFVELSGYPEHVLHDEHIGKVMPEDDIDQAEELIQSLLSSGERRGTFESEVVTAAGDRIPAESHVTLLFDQGEFDGSVGVIRVISERLERQRQLERERDRFEEFANVLSHDLRNPLNVAAGRLELLKDDCESEHLETLERSHHRMESLIDDMLSLANAGRMIAEPEPVELASLAESCWQAVETRSAELLAETDLVIEADQSRLRQLLENLVRNAVEHGGQHVTVTVGELEDGFFVEDDGAGIPPDERQEIFAPGYSSMEDGIGFGLNIVREIADAHGWRIDLLESTEGGARFEFTEVELQ